MIHVVPPAAMCHDSPGLAKDFVAYQRQQLKEVQVPSPTRKQEGSEHHYYVCCCMSMLVTVMIFVCIIFLNRCPSCPAVIVDICGDRVGQV